MGQLIDDGERLKSGNSWSYAWRYGWLRVPHLDVPNGRLEAWEQPDGCLYGQPKGYGIPKIEVIATNLVEAAVWDGGMVYRLPGGKFGRIVP